jgi:cytidyltransferase-like protein
MNYKFEQLVEALLKEVGIKKLGVFPGKFKPPHKGHFKTCEQASKENELVFVLISNKEHEGFTAEQSLKIWSIYKKLLPNIFPFVVTPTPVLGCYNLANILNNGGEFLSEPPGQPPGSNIQQLIDSSKELQSFIRVGNNIELNLYSSPEDQDRYKRIKTQPYMGKTVINIEFKPVDRLTSATEFRAAIKTRQGIENFLPPGLGNNDVKQIINILNGKL